uniref:KRAB domain-containing protein n=1 Tax=Pelusios castaneus TaxID=367368 RepID=A0A8C8SRX0_9SAUR
LPEPDVGFEDVALYFTRAQWELLSQPEKQLYRDQMVWNYRALVSLGKDQIPFFYYQLLNVWVPLKSQLPSATQGTVAKLLSRPVPVKGEIRVTEPGAHITCLLEDLFLYSPTWNILCFPLKQCLRSGPGMPDAAETNPGRDLTWLCWAAHMCK